MPALASIPPLPLARVAGPYAQTAVDTAAAQGVPPERLAAALGLPADALAPVGESLAVATYLQLLDVAAERCGDPLFGLHVGERARLSTFASYGLVLCACDDFRAAARQTMRFEALAHDLGRSHIEEDGAIAHYRWSSPWLTPTASRHLAESVMAGILGFANWLAHARLPVLDVSFKHAAPDATLLPTYARLFGSPVQFSAPYTGARFPASVLDQAVPNADPSLFGVLAGHAERLLAARAQPLADGIVEAVHAQIAGNLARDRARLADVAAALNCTPRTLQRRLAEAGTSYQGELDRTRRQLAQTWLRDPTITLTEVAFLLGYREQSSFNHAFRDWFGTTPALWRQHPPSR